MKTNPFEKNQPPKPAELEVYKRLMPTDVYVVKDRPRVELTLPPKLFHCLNGLILLRKIAVDSTLFPNSADLLTATLYIREAQVCENKFR